MQNILNIHKGLVNLIVISSIYQKFLKASLELYGWQFDTEEIPALFDNCYAIFTPGSMNVFGSSKYRHGARDHDRF